MNKFYLVVVGERDPQTVPSCRCSQWLELRPRGLHPRASPQLVTPWQFGCRRSSELRGSSWQIYPLSDDARRHVVLTTSWPGLDAGCASYSAWQTPWQLSVGRRGRRAKAKAEPGPVGAVRARGAGGRRALTRLPLPRSSARAWEKAGKLALPPRWQNSC